MVKNMRVRTDLLINQLKYNMCENKVILTDVQNNDYGFSCYKQVLYMIKTLVFVSYRAEI